jgi:hypothetical protein
MKPVNKVFVTLGTLTGRHRDKLTGVKYTSLQTTELIAVLGGRVDVYYVLHAENRPGGIRIVDEWRSIRWGSKKNECIRVNVKASLTGDVIPRLTDKGNLMQNPPDEEARDLIVAMLRIKKWCKP